VAAQRLGFVDCSAGKPGVAGGQPTLELNGLSVGLQCGRSIVPVLDTVSLRIPAGRTLCLAGESGSGKSLLAYTIAGLLPPAASVQSGQVLLDGVDLLSLPPQRRRLAGSRHLGMIFQEPMTALNPVLRIGAQVAEAARIHGYGARAAEAMARAMLGRVHIDDPHRVMAAYPHQLSGGMRQRVFFAMALILERRLLIADEPTTALDVTIQAEVLELLREAQHGGGMAMLFITHDLGVVAEIADEVAILYAGRVVEQAPVRDLFARPRHPYTQSLLAARPTAGPAGRARTALAVIPGRVPAPGELRTGCAFAPRCRHALPACTVRRPSLEPAGGSDPAHRVACFAALPALPRAPAGTLRA
jgi:peptide/nickel transport system ATP-binding protein